MGTRLFLNFSLFHSFTRDKPPRRCHLCMPVTKRSCLKASHALLDGQRHGSRQGGEHAWEGGVREHTWGGACSGVNEGQLS